MDTIKVVIAIGLQERYQRQIKDLDSRLEICDAGDLVSAELLRKLQMKPASEKSEQLDSLLREVEVILMYMPPLDLIARAPKLRWVQFIGAGIDRVAEADLLGSEVIITNARGIHAVPIAEYVLGTMLMFAKKMPLNFLNQQRKRWEPFVTNELREKTIGIVGLGNIGREVARLAKAFGMRVVATRRSVLKQESGIMGVDKVYPSHELMELLGECDFVVLSPPLTKETARMMGEQQLRAMMPTSYLINISRGGVIDESVLVRALREGWIAGAALDVFDNEPLPPDNELWQLSNVILTPHISGLSEMYMGRVTDLFCENLKRYLGGQQLLNIVDKEKGY